MKKQPKSFIEASITGTNNCGLFYIICLCAIIYGFIKGEKK